MHSKSLEVIDVALLHQSVEIHADERPGHVAILEKKRSITYADLCSQMLKLASLIRGQGSKPNDRVGFYSGNGIESCLSILGILRADCCYVPMNTTFPALRLADVIEDSEMRIIVTVKKQLKKLCKVMAEVGNVTLDALIVLDVDDGDFGDSEQIEQLKDNFRNVFGSDSLELASAEPRPCSNIEEDLCYIMYTSGTTGKPKGVMLTHKNVKSFVRWGVDYFKFVPEDRISNHSSISFDLSVFDIFGTFFAGATLCPVTKPGDQNFPGKFMKEMEITVWFSVPSVIGMLRQSDQLELGAFSEHLRIALFCGEAISPEHANAWIETHPSIPIFNLYGPTEAAIACTCHNVGVDTPFDRNSSVPIGRPCRDTQILIMKEDKDELADVGEVGKLMICGSQVAAGYWKRPDLTKSVFRLNPCKSQFGALMYESGDLAYVDEGGILYCLGRVDNQVKVGGYRIELGDIDVALGKHDSINEAAAVCVIEGGSALLVAGVALSSGAAGEEMEESLLSHCESFLPAYMIPKRVSFFDVLPKNVNGKIDRKAIMVSVELKEEA